MICKNRTHRLFCWKKTVIGRLRLNRPDARNALSDELVADLTALLDYLAQRDDIRGITVRGNGDAFCAGGDLKGFKNNFSGNPQ